MGWGMGFMGLWWLIGLIVLVLFIVLLVRVASGTSTTTTRDSAEQILRERYARGEIDKDEFDRRLSDLRR